MMNKVFSREDLAPTHKNSTAKELANSCRNEKNCAIESGPCPFGEEPRCCQIYEEDWERALGEGRIRIDRDNLRKEFRNLGTDELVARCVIFGDEKCVLEKTDCPFKMKGISCDDITSHLWEMALEGYAEPDPEGYMRDTIKNLIKDVQEATKQGGYLEVSTSYTVDGVSFQIKARNN